MNNRERFEQWYAEASNSAKRLTVNPTLIYGRCRGTSQSESASGEPSQDQTPGE